MPTFVLLEDRFICGLDHESILPERKPSFDNRCCIAVVRSITKHHLKDVKYK